MENEKEILLENLRRIDSKYNKKLTEALDYESTLANQADELLEYANFFEAGGYDWNNDEDNYKAWVDYAESRKASI